MISVPIFSTRAVNTPELLRPAFDRVVASQRFALGDEVERFEAEFAAYCGARDCVGVGNGTDALEIALRALGVKAGDGVVTVANAGYYASTAIHAIGAAPAYVDVDPQSLTLSPASLSDALSKLEARPKAIIATHLYGRMADMSAILALADEAGIPVVEDCAQAHGARFLGQGAGTFGRLGCYSFYPTKNLGAIGDGGAVVGSDAELVARVRRLRQYGWGDKYHVVEAGGRNSRLDTLQAAILREKLPHLDRWNAERQAILARYRDGLADLVRFPATVEAKQADVAHLAVIRLGGRERNAVQAALGAAGIGTDVHYPVPDHWQKANRNYLTPVLLGETERASGDVLTLPCFPGMAEEDVEHVLSRTASVLAEIQPIAATTSPGAR
ncbi:dTDP-4-amino-4,6-dideoxygalactose transaminase [Fulvimarina manganoxydans]|uniref:dTDP-4-amino-4,6-dideoxygalactose transaminase n=1 Tax=Fulvimarina manganoxydans TaxID=937218 RepID=A0A1W2EGQ7_9HYPH|nr:DegT/DnrJ/EryC1/StrS family aminotransferase [Fulvimarina manganoxydans]SMD08901.1 dTDP-4-amino-4,6-dideoxygalactose transaminase [Fulvimarina manganoxydans]